MHSYTSFDPRRPYEPSEHSEFFSFDTLSSHNVEGVFEPHGKEVIYAPVSLFLFSTRSKFRKNLVWLINWGGFEMVIVACVFFSTWALVIYDYNDRQANSAYNQALRTIGNAINFVFILEAILKIMAMGFIMQQGSYLRSIWNFIDLLVAISG